VWIINGVLAVRPSQGSSPPGYFVNLLAEPFVRGDSVDVH
jgi:hypothetical protein